MALSMPFQAAPTMKSRALILAARLMWGITNPLRRSVPVPVQAPDPGKGLQRVKPGLPGRLEQVLLRGAFPHSLVR